MAQYPVISKQIETDKVIYLLNTIPFVQEMKHILEANQYRLKRDSQVTETKETKKKPKEKPQ